jgi:hypothetical protein
MSASIGGGARAGVGEQRGGRAMKRYDGTGGAIAILLVVVAFAVMAEVVAGRVVAPPLEPPPATSWEPLLRVGDEARLRGDTPAARRAYLAGLFRARGESSLDGVLLAAEAFADLGDREVARHAVGMASALEPGDTSASSARLAALRQRLEAVPTGPAAAAR